MAEMAENSTTPLYVTFEDLVDLGLEDDFIIGEDYTSTVP